MKIKLMIALVILALVFGMVLASCDDGELPKIKEGTNETILDKYLLGNEVTPPGGVWTDDDADPTKSGNLLDPVDDTLAGPEKELKDWQDTWYSKTTGDPVVPQPTPPVTDPDYYQPNAGKGWLDYIKDQAGF